jgi:hypothetical protein
MDRLDAEAEAMFADLGVAAYHAARKREHEASDDTIANWNRIAMMIAQKIGKGVGVDTSARMMMNAVLIPDREPEKARLPRSSAKPSALDELARILEAKQFRIQFVGATSGRGQVVLREVEIEAFDVSAAIIAAANVAWPPHTTCLRILDHEGREVFARHKVAQS